MTRSRLSALAAAAFFVAAGGFAAASGQAARHAAMPAMTVYKSPT